MATLREELDRLERNALSVRQPFRRAALRKLRKLEEKLTRERAKVLARDDSSHRREP